MKEQKRKRINKAEEKRALCKRFIHKKICDHTERNVYNQRHITDTESGFILYHSGYAVKSRRRKRIFYDKKVIIKRKHHRNQENKRISRKRFYP